jgi:4,5-DOPA dioxygenase extradiol
MTTNSINQTQNFPAIFVGHGSPMNAIGDNKFIRGWEEMAKLLPIPKAILCISAHWETNGSRLTSGNKPKTIHDFGGFPDELYQIQYPASGSQWLINEVQKLAFGEVIADSNWGLDHGSWSVLKHLYPKADVPVVQLSLDYNKTPQEHYDFAQKLTLLRQKEVLIIGSGNIIHNFQYARFDGSDQDFATDWAIKANETFKKLISDFDHNSLINYQTFSPSINLAVPTQEHFLPLLYTLAVTQKTEKIQFYNDIVTGGAFGMLSVIIG